jgi:hypothetical protein
MNRRILIVALLLLALSAGVASAFTVSGTITGGQSGLTLKWVFGIPTSLDTIYLTAAIPFLNTYALSNVRAGSYLLLAYQDLNTNLRPDLDEPRGYWGGQYPEVFVVSSDTSGINIELQESNSGGFTGTVGYSGTNRGLTLIAAFDNPAFTGDPRGVGAVLDTTGVGDYIAVVDTFGVYYAYAFMDLNVNFTYDVGEPRGVYGGDTPLPIDVEPASSPDYVDIDMLDPSAVPEPPQGVVSALSLTSVYPNPFNSRATIVFTLESTSPVELAAFDLLGREAQHVATGVLGAGEHRIVLDAGGLPSGVYLVRLQAGKEATVTKVLLLR